MKKALLILGGVMLLTLGAVGMASANAGPHGNYGGGSSSPDGCAGCHRAHTAIGPYLLAAANPDALCEMCHGATGTTDVFDGILTSNNATLNGGGFDRMGGTTTSGTNVASRHDVEGVGGGTGEAWGSNSSGRGVTGVLECINCHNPHGSTNYRILTDASLPYSGTSESIKWVSGSAGLLYWQDSQVLARSDQPTTTAKYAPGSWAALSNTYYTMGINNFCATCHKQYVAYSGSYKVASNATNAA
ncbi:MAG: hypothetical protein M1358_12580, partial [Chloroflexi bacterium]|nr:hypothetical protein [Chloroflexota bacterium]